MDRKLEKKLITPKRVGMAVGVFLVIGMFLYSFVWMDSRSRLNVDRDRLMLHTVEEAPFQEYIDVSGTVQPLRTVHIEATEGGVVQRVPASSGTLVEEGDTVVVLSNSSLQLSVMQQEAGLYEQLNNVRNSRMALETNHLSLQETLASARTQLALWEPRFEGDQMLFDQGYISRQEFEETRQNYEFQRLRYELTYESFQRDSLQMINRMQQLEESEQRLMERIPAIQQILDELTVTAPIAGQISVIELEQGQSISPRERIGQVDLMDGFKIRANIDEFYLPRITTGLQGSFSFAGESYNLEISRLFPVIQNGQFQVDLEFTEGTPGSTLTRGQSVRIRLELDSPTRSLLVERGGFYQSTGGNWIYKLVENETEAVRQPIRLGRGNPQYFEVLEGLEPGDRVITSSYATFGDNEVLVLE
ncbi:MAG: HlyD family efflux transporter periplasmic adaptor subunit [Balneolaceae bacterium]